MQMIPQRKENYVKLPKNKYNNYDDTHDTHIINTYSLRQATPSNISTNITTYRDDFMSLL